MKKHIIVVLAACSILSISALQAAEEQQPQAFEDQPALTKTERAALKSAKVTGAVGGAWLGYRGVGAVSKKSGLFTPEKAAHFSKGLKAVNLMPFKERLDAILNLFYTTPEGRSFMSSGVLGWAGIGAGGYAGHKGLGSAAIYALAKLHGVSYRIEAISQYYNINLSQYVQILTVASLGNPDALIQAIGEVFPLRFGSDWNKRLERLFQKYSKRAESLIKPTTVIRKKDERDFIRMIELGAAMANLYYGTNPDPKNTVDSATQLYKELGLLK